MNALQNVRYINWVGFFIALFIIASSFFVTNFHKNKIDTASAYNYISLEAIQLLYDSHVHLKTQVQEWKDILLRGHNQKDYEKYLKQFKEESENFKKALHQLGDVLKKAKRLDAHMRHEIEAIVQAHILLEKEYYKALQSTPLNASGAYKKIDTLVRGKDRPLSPMIISLQKKLLDQSKIIRKETLASLKNVSIFLLASIVLSVLILFYTVMLQSKISQSNKMFEMIAQKTKDGIMVMENGRVVYVSPAYHKLLEQDTIGMSEEDIVNLIHPEDKERILALVNEAISKNKKSLSYTYRALHVQGYYIYKEDRVSLEYDDKGTLFRVYVISSDVTKEKQKEQKLKESEEKYRTFVELSSDMIFLKDKDFKYLIVNKNLANFMRKNPDYIIGKTDFELMVYRNAQNCRISDMRALESSETITSQEEINGRVYETTKYTMMFKNELCLAGVIRDITEQVKSQDEIHNLAFYDVLTLLPNRKLFLDRLEHAFNVFKNKDIFGGIILMDIDNFKIINDTWGHDKGDKLLKAISNRLTQILDEHHTLARLGGDEFAILLEDLSSKEIEASKKIVALAENIKIALQHPYEIDQIEHICTLSMGATLFNASQFESNIFIKEAEIALYKAKEDGRNTVRFFETSMQEKLSMRYYLESSLRNAIKAQEFELYYQPQVNSAMEIVGAETLIRWNHEGRVISPSDFIPVLEETGLIVEVGMWVLQEAVKTLVKWADDEKKKLWSLSINVSAKQFEDEGFIQKVTKILQENSFHHSNLKMEITENLFLKNTQTSIEKIETLRKMGLEISLDDFGTGYSSLSYLKRIPITQLKIDQSFVRDVFEDSNDAQIIDMIIAVANNLNLSLVAEGVETFEQFEWLDNHGCNIFQGFYIDKPQKLAMFEKVWGNFVE